jgi:hypothetical protein
VHARRGARHSQGLRLPQLMGEAEKLGSAPHFRVPLTASPLMCCAVWACSFMLPASLLYQRMVSFLKSKMPYMDTRFVLHSFTFVWWEAASSRTPCPKPCQASRPWTSKTSGVLLQNVLYCARARSSSMARAKLSSGWAPEIRKYQSAPDFRIKFLLVPEGVQAPGHTGKATPRQLALLARTRATAVDQTGNAPRH